MEVLFYFLFGHAGSSSLWLPFRSCVSGGYLSVVLGLLNALVCLVQSAGSRAPRLGTCSSWAQELQLSGSSTGSIVVVHGLSCSAACGVFSDQGSNPCLLHWQVDSLPLDRQKSPILNSDESKVRSVLIKPTSLSQSS